MISSDIATSCTTPRTFAIADLHLGDERVAKARGFKNAKAMADEIAARWSNTVSDRDMVYVLGDVAKRGHLMPLHALGGVKHLVCGNADDLQEVLAARLFATVTIARWMPGCLLTHIPVHPSQLRGQSINVHGHLHSGMIKDPRYMCVSAEQIGYAPFDIREATSGPSVVGRSRDAEHLPKRHSTALRGPSGGLEPKSSA